MNEKKILDLEKELDDFIIYKNKRGELTNKNDQNRYRKAAILGCEHFQIQERGLIDITDEMLQEYQYELIGDGNAKNTAKAYITRFNVFYTWLKEKKQLTLFNDVEDVKEKTQTKMITQEPPKVTQATQETQKKVMKKITFETEYTTYEKLMILAMSLTKKRVTDGVKGKITLADLINEGVKLCLEKYEKLE